MKNVQLKLMEVPAQFTPPTNSDAELIDAILGTSGKGQCLINKYHSLAAISQNLNAASLTDAQRKRLRAAFCIHFVSDGSQPKVNSPSDIFDLLKDLQAESQENFVVLLFDRRNKLIERINLYKGTVSACTIKIAEVFKDAIVRSASAIAIAHNHPSGDPTPSPDDVAVTRAIKAAGELLEIQLLDHVVVGHARYVSLKERGLAF